ncbi:HAD hydrolase-like protein, partial [Acinetobacter baumannii]|nr:HAD hydrolase-like protein [Acinetobacter baumannii]
GYKKILRKYGFTPEETAAVGDQVLTDIAGANRMGILTILVDPLSNDNNIFGKGVKLISRSLCRLLKDMPRKGEYY